MKDPIIQIIETHLQSWAAEDTDPVTTIKWIFDDCVHHLTQGGFYLTGSFKAEFVEDIFKEVQSISRKELLKPFPQIDLKEIFQEFYSVKRQFKVFKDS